MKKRWIAILMSAMVAATGIPGTAMAAQTDSSETDSESTQQEESDTDEVTDCESVTDTTQEGEADASKRLSQTLKENSDDLQTADTIDDEEITYEPDELVTVIVELNGDTVENTKLSFFQSLTKNAEHNRVKKKIEKLVDDEDDSYEEKDDFYHVMNGFTIEVEYQYLEEIKELSGVKNAFVDEVHYLENTSADETKTQGTQSTSYKNDSSRATVGADTTEYTGKGQVIAIIDSGVDLNHEAFSGTIEGATMTDSDVSTALEQLNASSRVSSLSTSDVYHNEKIPYTFDYADNDTDAIPGSDDLNHGTHVAGIASANGGSEIRGVAPDAQIVVMKAFSDGDGSGYDSNIIAAVEDAYVLDVDSINMSLGADVGFSVNSEETYERIYQNVGDAGIALNVAAGNAYSQSTYGTADGTGLADVSHVDNGMVATPSTESAALAVASAEDTSTGYYFKASDDSQIKYREATLTTGDEKTKLNTVTDAIEYVDCGLGTTQEIEKAGDISGKYALIQRGGQDSAGNNLTFEAKADNAYNAGAKGIIVYNNVESDVLTDMGGITKSFVSVFISKEDGEKLLALEDKTITVSSDYTYAQDATMSDFSSWGVTPDLKLKPEITAPGGNIYSSVLNDAYTTMSGTSMATPQLAGLTALAREYVESDEKFASYTEAKKDDLVTNLLMCSAVPLKQSGASYYSPRKQGAGEANINNATNAKAYLTVEGADDAKPKAELGDSSEGTYSFTITAHNLTDEDLTYTVDTSALSEVISDGRFMQKEKDYAGQGIDISYSGLGDGNTLSVSAGNEVSVTVTITANEEFKDAVKEAVNGTFIEGFVQLTADETSGSNLSIPYLGFYGDWGAEDLIENAYTDEDNSYLFKQSAVCSGSNSYYYLGQNVFTGAMDADRFAISNNSLGQIFQSVTTMTGLKRCASKMTYVVTDEDGNEIWSKEYSNVRKSYYYMSSLSATMTYAEAFLDSAPVFDGTDNNGHQVADGTYTMTITAAGCDENATEDTWSFDFTYDTKAPVVKTAEVVETDDGKKIHLIIEDNHYLSAAQVVSSNGGAVKTIDFDEPTYSENGVNRYEEYLDYDEIAKKLAKLDGARTDVISLDIYDYAVNYKQATMVIEDTYPEAVTLDEDNVTLTKGQQKQLKATFTPEEVTMDQITWSSSNDKVATVDENGLISAVSAGEATITAQTQAKGVAATCKVTVKEVSAEQGLLMSRDTAEVKMGETVTLSAILAPSLEGSEVTWSSSDETLATVDKDGVVSALSTGVVTITASVTSGDQTYSDDCEVTIRPANYDDFVIDEDGVLVEYTGGKSDVEIPQGVTKIGENAFYGMPITSVSVPSSVLEIGPYAFNNCQKLETVTFAEGSKLSKIDEAAFYYCYLLKNIVLPDTVRELGANMFYYCYTLDTINVPEGVTEICDYAFYNTSGLKNVTLPSTLKRIGKNAFGTCGVEQIEVPQGVTTIDDYAFSACSLKSFTCPESVETIGAAAFMSNGSMTSITLNEGLKTIGEAAFSSTGLTTLSIPDSVTSVGASIAVSDSSLVSVHIGKNVPDLETPFGMDTVLETITVDDDNTMLEVGDDGALYDEDYTRLIAVPYKQSEITTGGSFTLKATVKKIEPQVFYNMTALTKVNYEDGTKLESIGDHAFYATSIQEIVLPDLVKSVGGHCFANCVSTTKVVLNHVEEVGSYAFLNTMVQPDFGDSLKVIGKNAFASDTQYEKQLTDVTLPDTVEVIGDGAFMNLYSVQNVSLGSCVKEIGDCVFTGNNGLSTITVADDNPYFVTEDNVLYDKDKTRLVLYAPACEATTYTAPDSLKQVDGFGFRNAKHLTKVTLNEGLEELSVSAFNGCSSLKDINMPSTLKKINSFAFSDVPATNLVFDGDLELIDDWGLSFMSNLNHLVIRKANNATIGGTYNLEGNETMYFGDGVKKITGTLDSSSTKVVVLGDDIEEISDDAFSAMKNVTIYATKDTKAYELASKQVKTLVANGASASLKEYTPLSVKVRISQASASAQTKISAKAAGGVGTKEYKFVSVDEDGNETLLRDYSTKTTYTADIADAGTTIRAYVRDNTYYETSSDLTVKIGDVIENGAYVAKATLTDAKDKVTDVLTKNYKGAVSFEVADDASKIYLPITDVTSVKADGVALKTDEQGNYLIPITSIADEINLKITTQDETVDALLQIDTDTIAEAADKTALLELLEEAGQYEQKAYETESYRSFYTVRKASKEVCDDILADQEQVNEAYTNLEKAIDALEIKLVKGRSYNTNVSLVKDEEGSGTSMANTMLRKKAVVTYNEDETWNLNLYFVPGNIYGYEVNGQNVDQLEYVDVSGTNQIDAEITKDATGRGVRVFTFKIKSLKTFATNIHFHYSNEYGQHSSSATVYVQFDDPAKMSVVTYEDEQAADTAKLESMIDKAVTYEEDDYTPATWKELQTELEDAKEVLDDDSAEQNKVDEALEALTGAVDHLKQCANTPKITSSDGASNKVFEESKRIRISTDTDKAKIYYTLDGTTPTKDSEEYTGPITLKESAVVRAIAVKDGLADSREVQAEFICVTDTAELSADAVVENFGYTIRVTMKVFNGEIAKVSYSYPKGEPNVNDKATMSSVASLANSYIGKDVSEVADLKVDVVSGATYSSNAFIQAIKEAAKSYVPVTGLKVDCSSLSLKAGECGKVTPITTPANATEKLFVYASDNEKVALVDATGKVTAVAKGTANITITTKDGKFCAKTKVTVKSGSDTTKSSADTTTNTEKKDTTSKIKIGYKKTINGLKYQVISSKQVQVYGASSKKVKKVVIPSTVKISGTTFKVTKVKASAFAGYKKLKKVTIGANVKSIGKKAFYGDKKLSKIIIKTKSLTKSSIGKKAFTKTAKKAKVYVPSKKLKIYKKYLKSAGLNKKAKVKKS
ncbi:MAG: leucine-rich repeat protein [Eubacterium sp.]|nr:leucine-rich repeat protein [Eubacterium sp.]